MKKNFFKKLSFVLALAMIVSVLAPAAGAFAATAPKLSASTKYLYLGDDTKGEYDFNISNKVTGWKYLWSSANEKVAEVDAKNGVTTATGAGSTKVSVVITDKNGEEKAELTATVVVRDNIKELTITGVPTDNKLAVGVTNDFNRSYVTFAGKKSGSEAKTAWTVTKDGKATTDATIDASGVFVAKAAGEYVVEARAFQSSAKRTAWVSDPVKYASYVTSNVASVKVTVAATMTGVKQTALAVAQVSFDSAMTDVAKNISVYQLIGTTKVKQLVKEVKLDDAKKVATVTMYVAFNPESTYVVDYTGMKSVQFVAARTKAEDVKSMEITTKTAVLNEATVVEYKLLNAEGVDITTAELKTRVTMTASGEANTAFAGGSIYMYKKDVTTTVKAVYHSYKYNSTTGAEEGNIEAAGVITCVEANPTNVTGLNAWTIKGTGDTPDYGTTVHSVAAGDTGKRLFVKLDTLKGTTTGSVESNVNGGSFEFTSSDQSVVMVQTNGTLTVNKEGTAVIVVKYGTGTTKAAVATVELTVSAKRAASQFSLSTYEFTLSNSSTFVDNKDVQITLKDQLGVDFPYTEYKIERLSGPATDITNMGTNGVVATADGKINFFGSASSTSKTAGTYVYKITVKDISRVITVTVTAPTTSTGVSYYGLELSAATVDTKATTDKVLKNLTVKLFGYASNGIKLEEVTTLASTTPTSGQFYISVDAPYSSVKDFDQTYLAAGADNYELVTVSGGAIVKVPTGQFKVTAYRYNGTTSTLVPLDTQYFAITDTQVAPVISEVTTKLYNTSVSSYAANSASLIQAVKDCYKFSLNGVATTNVVAVEADGTGSSTYITSVTLQETIQVTSGTTATLDHKLTIGDYITLK